MELRLSPRTILGKKAKRVRAGGEIPGELYGHGVENRHVSVNQKEFAKVYGSAGENTIINALLNGDEKVPVLVSSVNRNPISGSVISIDFHQIRMDEKISTQVPISFHGESPAAKAGLVVIKVLNEIHIESLPGKIPHEFAVSLEKLEKPGDTVSVSDIKTPEGVKILLPADATIVIVQEQRKEEAVPAPTAFPTETAEGEAKVTDPQSVEEKATDKEK